MTRNWTSSKSSTWLLWATLLAFVFVSASSGTAAARDNRFALVGIENRTGVTINYFFRWGERAEWTRFEVGAHSSVVQYFTYPVLNQNSSPTPQIRFDIGVAVNPRILKTYSLDAYASPDKTFRNSRQHYFDITTIVTGEKAIDLYKKGP